MVTKYYFLLDNNHFLGGPLPTVLQEVDLPIMTNDICKDMIFDAGGQSLLKNYNYTVPNTMICAGGKEGKSSCHVST